MSKLKKFLMSLIEKLQDDPNLAGIIAEIKAELEKEALVWNKTKKWIYGIIASIILNAVQLLLSLWM